MIASVSVKNKIEADYIISGKCGAGDKLPPIRSLAKEYGVSYVTLLEAIRILAHEEKVVKRQGSGVYIPLNAAKRTENRSTRKIGYITNNFLFQNAYGYKILDGIGRVTEKTGYRLEVASSNFNFEREKRVIKKMAEGEVEGIVLYPVPRGPDDQEYLASSEFKDIPIVVVDLARPQMQRPSVVFDNFSAGYEMTKYLISKGHRRVVFLHNIMEKFNGAIQDRTLGFLRAAESESSRIGSESSFSVEYWHGDKMEALKVKIEELMTSKNPPDAIIAAYDIEAANMYFWLTSKGYNVPSDIEVVGFDNVIPEFMPWFNLKQGYSYHWPTTNPDFVRLGEKAAELLLEVIESKGKINKEIVLPCPLLRQRQSMHSGIYKELV
jgi:DNA-binding LacI/PurR family transcriptional regulator